MTASLHLGDCLDVMATLEAESVDAIVTDPPYGLSFMGKNWDHGVPGERFWREALRVAKPGAHLLAFGGTRTFHRLTCAIEDAGWEIRDCIGWIYGSGFPKSLDVSKAIDREAGAEREIVGINPNFCENRVDSIGTANGIYGGAGPDKGKFITAPATDAAKQWEGWGTALKPSYEPIIVARKPIIGTVAQNVLRYGTGAINVDGCRVEPCGDVMRRANNVTIGGNGIYQGGKAYETGAIDGRRWPANIIHDGSEEVVGLFPITSSGEKRPEHNRNVPRLGNVYSGDPGGQVPRVWHADSGSASRFFYCAKASKADRDEGCEELEAKQGRGDYGTFDTRNGSGGEWSSSPSRNHHPTVKPTELMRYLCRLVTPPNGVILDPFMGSGSTGKGALLEGFRFVGIEREPEYLEIARARLAHVMKSEPPILQMLNERTPQPEPVIHQLCFDV